MVLRASVAAVLSTTTFIFARTILFPDDLVLQLGAAFAMGAVGYSAPSWWNAWGWPFAWILLISMVTTMWSYYLLDPVLDDVCTLVKNPPAGSMDPNIYRCPPKDVMPTLLPGLLNLVAFGWVLSGRREVRWAALLAGTLGAVRLAAPLLIYRLSGADAEIVDWSLDLSYGKETTAILSGWLWLLSGASAIAFLVGAKVVESRKRKREQAPTAMQARAQDERAQLLARLRGEGLITDQEYESKRPDLPSGT